MRAAWFGLALVSLLALAWMGRYDFVSNRGVPMIVLDRWTHTASWCTSTPCEPTRIDLGTHRQQNSN
jgi:hypothetical protein